MSTAAMLRCMRRPHTSRPPLLMRCFSTSNSPSPSPPSFSPSPPLPSRLGVIGGGQMGTGIAYVASVTAKLPVLIVDSSSAQLDRSRGFLVSLLDKDEKKGRLTAQQKADAMQRFAFASNVQQLVDEAVPFIIEAVTERFPVKGGIFEALAAAPSSTVVATNTSSISITKLASTAPHPSSFIGMHFMNPVPVMQLVEVIPGLQTSPSTLHSTLALARALGKQTTLSRDVPGFIANRLLMPYINEACQLLGEGVGSREDIDATMKLGTNMPMGPLTLADFIGLDTCLSIMQVLHEGLGDSKYRPAVILHNYVDAGWLGKKSGRGFYDYSGGK